ncbi:MULTISPECIES: substrate-binding domain-containing protein [Clostridia]|uniref:substrate-binding domain-containing protein n=1 Tax=Clostridia TaxID=186801 RepID=UPI0015FD3FE7|nr:MULTISPECIES: substrate-binding domain-containing protein [Clostridia]
MKLRKISSLFMVAALVVTILGGCGSEKEESGSKEGKSADKETLTIGITVQDLSNEFVANEKTVIMDLLETDEYSNVEVQFLDGANDSAKQIQQMESFMNQKVDAIICNCVESTALAPSVEQAIDAGIPVVCMGTDVDQQYGQVWIGSPDEPGAEQAMQYAIDNTSESANIAIMRGVIGHHAEMLRSEGYEAVLKKYPDVKIVFDQSANYSRDEGMQLMETWLQSGTKIDAVVCQNDEMALGAAAAVDAAGLSGKMVITGIDGVADALTNIKDGIMSCTLYQPGDKLATTALEYAVAMAHGEKKEETTFPQELVTQENVDDYISK